MQSFTRAESWCRSGREWIIFWGVFDRDQFVGGRERGGQVWNGAIKDESVWKVVCEDTQKVRLLEVAVESVQASSHTTHAVLSSLTLWKNGDAVPQSWANRLRQCGVSLQLYSSGSGPRRILLRTMPCTSTVSRPWHALSFSILAHTSFGNHLWPMSWGMSRLPLNRFRVYEIQSMP